MKITPEQYDKIQRRTGRSAWQRKNFKHRPQRDPGVAENGRKWRALPKEFGPWHTIYTRMRRWADHKVPRAPESLKTQLLIELDITALLLDSIGIKVHPCGTGVPQKKGRKKSAKVAAGGTRSCIQ